MKKINFLALFVAIMMTAMLFGCQGKNNVETKKTTDKKVSIICTNFAEYDFVRQIIGDKADLTMLLKPGAESHSYEPTPQDIIKIQNSDMFIYVGGDSDEWVDDVLKPMNKDKMHIIKLMDCVNLVEEELVEGMQPEEEEEDKKDADKKDADKKDTNTKEEKEEEPEMDEHVWTSPENAIKIVKSIKDTLLKIDSVNSETYNKNADAYVEKLTKLDNDFKDVINNAKRKEIIVGDRFPFRYFCEEYGLKYYAAFPGCSTDTEANPSTVAFLIDKVKQDNIPIVFHIELSNGQMCNSICEATGAKAELLNAVHNVSDDDFKAGITYIDLMQHNVEVLKKALN